MPDTMLLRYEPESLQNKVSPIEWEARVNAAAACRVAYHLGWNNTINNHISLRVPDEPDKFLQNPYGLGWHEITASSLIKADFAGKSYTKSDLSLSPAGANFHAAILKLRPDLASVIHVHPIDGVVISTMRDGLLPLDQGSATYYGKVAYHDYEGLADEADEGPRIVDALKDNHMMIMWNHGLLTTGRTIGEAFTHMYALSSCCERQAKVLSMNREFKLIPEEICQKLASQMTERYRGKTRGDAEWKMYRRLAEQLDPSYRS